jgi:MoxR-like ATPase
LAGPAKKFPIDSWHSEVKRVADNIAKVIVGKDEIIRLVLVALLAGGHCLIEDVPGVGKTMLVRATAISIGCEFKRIQFTPDLLPSDVTGVSIYNQGTHQFEFRPGPIFGQIVLADEINRTSPKTQSALLESLEEQHVTVDGTTYALPKPFFVLATENPIEFEGTFPLPEAQLDRFLLKFRIGYPSLENELDILTSQRHIHPVDTLQPVVDPSQILTWREQAADIHVDDTIKKYIVQLIQATREHPHIYLGASPRASIALYKASQALAFLAGRTYVVPDDVRALAMHVIEHRILLSADARLSGIQTDEVIAGILKRLPVPILHGVSRT